ncbi:MAG: 5-methyltetrahydropteroyltriglutamate--homocysteine methyltransferase [Alphaproteobacteria bacterium]|jgi:5-methyltetrahydropteroyltriglutamate--homocysteine methyltransferase|nr:5-methyltetrahydropteroyltriglutamate--homocysteine methyltransferase [Alphaproteobacteria bacterium]MDP6515163.1 5-methyltetrahydropteroyltriglutamate--homocysteine methyltransferase [Alphaproteobacteria bacterium]
MTDLLPTTVVGSYPQPDWLIDRGALAGRSPPRVRAESLWRVPEDALAAAQDDATRLAIADIEAAGIDIVGDGEMRRESYSNQFANALDGIDLANPGIGRSRRGEPDPLPRVVGPIRRARPVHVDDVGFLRAHCRRRIKITVPGPFTMSQQAVDEHYHDPAALALAYADAVNQEVRDLHAAGADVVQIDEPFLQARPEPANAYGIAAIDRALAGVRGTTAVHLCLGYAALITSKPSAYDFLTQLDACAADQISIEAAQPGLDLAVLEGLPSKTIILGVLDLGAPEIETPDQVAARLRAALAVVPPERLIAAPDCGMKYLPRAIARAKLEALVAGTALVRQSLR